MKRFGYMWDDSKESAVHAIEECFVRGVSSRLSGMSKGEEEEFIGFNVESGFLLVSAVVKSCRNVDENNIEDLIKRVLPKN